MKHVVVTQEMHEADIRPPTLLSEFKRLSVQDAQRFFGDRANLVEVDPPSTGAGESTFAFEKDGFRYMQAQDCGSLYVSPRPTKEALADYYRNSEASAYRVRHYAKETAEARRRHLLRSHANWMGRLYDEHGNAAARSYVDIGTNSPAIFDEVRRLGLFDKLYSLNPLPGLESECKARGVEVIHEPIRDAGAVTAFQQLESQFSPLDLVKTACDMLAVGGLFFMTTRTISGFDLQMLWDKTPYIFVPEHLNLLSIEGMTQLIARAGLHTVELSTPGQLDLELVQHAARNDANIQLPRFIKYLLDERDDLAHADFQEYLQKHRLSSHVRVAAARREGVPL
jgi:hypothetical protein